VKDTGVYFEIVQVLHKNLERRREKVRKRSIKSSSLWLPMMNARALVFDKTASFPILYSISQPKDLID
jgi:hypothetical protein